MIITMKKQVQQANKLANLKSRRRTLWLAEDDDGNFALGKTMEEAFGRLCFMERKPLALDDDDGNLTGEFIIEVVELK